MINSPTNPRLHFPVFTTHPGLVYLDTAATAQRCQVGLDATLDYYHHHNANIHRGVHSLGGQATKLFENARKQVQSFINAKHSHEVICTSGATLSLNMVAQGWAAHNLQSGDVIVVSILEHHSNIVPWQMLQDKGIEIWWIMCDQKGNLDMAQYQEYLDTGRVKLVSITSQSNVLGVQPDIYSITTLAHKAEAKVCIDAAQLAVHTTIDVQALDCDFLVCSGHKLYGPTGVGVLYVKEELHQSFTPVNGGGNMINTVTKEGWIAADMPAKLEPGTLPIAQWIGLGATVQWLATHRVDQATLIKYAYEQLQQIEGITLLGPSSPTDNHGALAFLHKTIHAHDLTDLLSQQGIHLRAGHHCTMPLHKHLAITASSRMSFGIYNTVEDIDKCVEAIKNIISQWNRS